MTESHRCAAGRDCRDAENFDDPTTGKTTRRGAPVAAESGLCESCTGAARYAVSDMVETWLSLHLAIGDTSRRLNQKVSISRSAPINLNTDADALKTSIVEWLVAAAARVAETLNCEEPSPRNNTDAEHARVVLACTRILEPNIDTLIGLPAGEVMVWLSAAETQYPGERFYVDDHGTPHIGVKVTTMTGAELALKLVKLRSKARSFLALTTPKDKLSLPCWRCNQLELTRRHERRGTTVIDQVDCAACEKSWPYEQYQNIIAIRVKEDEMEREKLQKQLDSERTRREIAEWLLAERDWQLSLAFDFPDVSASVFVTTILTQNEPQPPEAFMSDKDIANLLNVSDSTVRSWASRGQIQRHTADDGSTVFLASEVWAFAKTNTGGRASTIRRLTRDTACAT
ncbi:hypothetical protein [Mycobacterium sp. E1747]|uniref:hypothetical protein n=1 Tax=Mycobacterium sp. E1747 TaxID=1834128 RepID=UPI000ABB3C2B|nr:hypothetical protein [Mycobacterium sp. E1747]